MVGGSGGGGGGHEQQFILKYVRMRAVCAQHATGEKKDYVCMNNKWNVYSIFDGHRTSKAAELASNKFMDMFRTQFTYVLSRRLQNRSESDAAASTTTTTPEATYSTNDMQLVDTDDVENILQRTFGSLDEMIEQHGHHNSGTLVVCAVVLKSHVLFCWLGDGRAFVVDDEHNWTEMAITPHTTDDTDEWLHVAHHRGYMTEKDNIFYVGGVLRYTRALGDADLPGLSKRAETLIVPRDKVRKICLASKTLTLRSLNCNNYA